MSLPALNLVAVFAATGVSFISGFLWFGPKTFYATWWRLMGRSAQQTPGGNTPMPIAFGSVLVGQFFQVLTLGFILSGLGSTITSGLDGALVGLLVGVGIAAASSLNHRIFAGHGFGVWLIEVGNDIINLGIAGYLLAVIR